MGTTTTQGRGRGWRILPVVERELRVASRGKGAYRWRTAVAAVGLGLMAAQSLSMTARQVPADAQGTALFRVLVGIAALYAVVASLSVTADSVSREKREGTLGLLFLTDLRGRDVILGKLAACSLNTVYGLLGLLPLLAIPVMMGGVSIHTGLLATGAMVNLLFVSLSVGILVTTLSWDERRATFAAFTTALALMIGPPLMAGMGVFFGGGDAGEWLVSRLSPLMPLLEAITGWRPVDLRWTNLVPSHLVGWVFLLTAAWKVEGVWQSRGATQVRRTLDERLFTPGTAPERGRLRTRLLEVHPLVWLLERHPGKRFYADGLVLAILAIWVWGYRSYGVDMFGGPSWFLVVPLAAVVHLIFAAWMVSECSTRWIEDRRSGALELLLCSALTDREILQGHRLALRRLFLRAVLILAAAEVYVAYNGFGSSDDIAARNGRWMMLSMAAALLLDTHGLSWIALRLAVTLPTVNRVGQVALLLTPVAPLGLTLLLGVGLRFFTEVDWRLAHGLALWVSCVAVVNLVVGQFWCRRSVERFLREEAIRTQPRTAVT